MYAGKMVKENINKTMYININFCLQKIMEVGGGMVAEWMLKKF